MRHKGVVDYSSTQRAVKRHTPAALLPGKTPKALQRWLGEYGEEKISCTH